MNTNGMGIARALISVFDKTGVEAFARALHTEFGIEIVSTGQTARLLRERGIPVVTVEETTGVQELLDGRVKTLHPKIHAAILADRDNPRHMEQLRTQHIAPIDLVVVNLYPFEETVRQQDCPMDEALEMIDIGGPSLIRAAAKNHRHVLVLISPRQYEPCLLLLRGEGTVSEHRFRVLAAKAAFERMASYDRRIGGFLAAGSVPATAGDKDDPRLSAFDDENAMVLRYGENPHQSARFVGDPCAGDLQVSPQCQISGEALSYNNLLDAHAAAELCRELAGELGRRAAEEGQTAPAVALFMKHCNPCGVGIGPDPFEAYRRAYLGDASAAMGGVLACSFGVTAEIAKYVMASYAELGSRTGAGGFFVEVWIAPHFGADSIALIQEAKGWGRRARLLALGAMDVPQKGPEWESRGIGSGMLIQTCDRIGLDEQHWRVATRRGPTADQWADLRFAWLVCKHTKSNAVTICRNGMVLGNGAGQMSRVMSARIAVWLARDNGHEAHLSGAVAASDGFFPFTDGPRLLADAGIKALIQPGGSKRDDEVIAACDENQLAMVMTGTRHFRH